MTEFSSLTDDWMHKRIYYQEIQDALRKRYSCALFSASADFLEKTYTNDDIVQQLSMWRSWQNALDQIILSGDWIRSCPLSGHTAAANWRPEKYTEETLFADAGLGEGLRYATVYDPDIHNWTDINDVMWTGTAGNGFLYPSASGVYNSNRIIGPWLVDDFQKLLKKLTCFYRTARWTAYNMSTESTETNFIGYTEGFVEGSGANTAGAKAEFLSEWAAATPATTTSDTTGPLAMFFAGYSKPTNRFTVGGTSRYAAPTCQLSDYLTKTAGDFLDIIIQMDSTVSVFALARKLTRSATSQFFNDLMGLGLQEDSASVIIASQLVSTTQFDATSKKLIMSYVGNRAGAGSPASPSLDDVPDMDGLTESESTSEGVFLESPIFVFTPDFTQPVT